jgi:protein-L-isoaspartate(D-aspartate) O-methyltransferase
MPLDYAHGPTWRGHGDKNIFRVRAGSSGPPFGGERQNGDRLMDAELAAARRWYAEDLRLQAPVLRNLQIVDAFAAVPRERFLGPGPWRIMPGNRPGQVFTTPDDQAHWLCHDVLVTIDEARGLNNGSPSLWAGIFDHLDLRRGGRVMQVGAGTGYYAAVLAEMVGPAGRIVAVEHDQELAERARAGLEPWRQVEVVAGDGRSHDPGEVDAIVVFAGSTHPAPRWLDRLAEGGRLIMPLTSENRWGFLLRAVRRGTRFEAASIGWVGIYPCFGGRDEEAGKRLAQALAGLRSAAGTQIPVRALHRGDPDPEAGDKVWYRAPDFWLERNPGSEAKPAAA